MDLIAKKASKNSERIVRAAALAMDTSLVTTTPVDSGRARGNYIVAIGAPSGVVRDIEGGNSGSTSLAQGQSVIKRWKLGLPAIFISNNLPYIVPLDQGSSAQAPEGMSRAALTTGQRIIKKGRLLGRNPL